MAAVAHASSRRYQEQDSMDCRSKLEVGLACLFAVAVVNAAPPSVEAFAQQEFMRDAQISPDGRYLAFISSVDGARVALTMDLKKAGKPVAVLGTEAGGKLDLSWCRWGNDTRLVCGFRESINVRDDFSFVKTKLAAVDADGKNAKELMRNDRVSAAQFKDEVLDWTPSQPRTVLIQAQENLRSTGTLLTSAATTPAVYELDLYSGGLNMMLRPHQTIREYYTDGNGSVRLGVGLSNAQRLFYARLLGEDSWRLLAKVETFAITNQIVPQHVLPGTNKAYAVALRDGRRALWEIDMEDREPPRLIFDHPRVDIDRFTYSSTTGKMLAFGYDMDRPFMQYEDEQLRTLLRGINKALPNTFNRPHSFTEDFGKLVVRASSDIDMGSYYLYDRETRGLKQLGRSYSNIPTDSLARMQAIEYPARDGTLIPGYLMIPSGKRPERLPFVVLPHGGPISRDTWQFDFLAQFLTTRGYGVLKMNFRGSSGYGQQWFHAAHQDWGGLTYSDILDGAHWVVDKGFADPQRTCIVGWSFGGYAALLGAVRNGDVFKCSVSIAGVSDLAELLNTSKHFINRGVVAKQIGDDSDKLKNDSPARNAAKVRIPVLMIHGTHDAQAPYEQSRLMASALSSAGKPHELLRLDGADHSIWRPADRATMLTKIEQFLATHIGNPATSP
jgi:dipeptidyl aminopeptidase/acylaminoacyl peptidase